MQHKLTLIAILAFALLAGTVQGEDTYYRIKLTDLELIEGQIPASRGNWWRHADRARQLTPRAIVDGEGEAYVAASDDGERGWALQDYGDMAIYIRVPQAREITGTLLLPDEQFKRLMPYRFRIKEDAFEADLRDAFLTAKLSHFHDMRIVGVPGQAYFRHQEAQLRAELGHDAPEFFDPRFPDDDGLLDTYDLFTGGVAISENLQLDRDMPVTDGAPEATVAIDGIRGITVAEMNWQERLGDAKPALDPLASAIPADQHAVFLPSVQAALGLVQMAEQHSTPVLQSMELQASEFGIRERYERQVGLRIADLAEIAGAFGVQSIALTGSDPHVQAGTDIAVILQTQQVDALHDALAERIAANRSRDLPAPAGQTRSFLGKLDGAVVITNSQVQMLRLVQVRDGQTPSLASLPEYAWFRMRYGLGDADEAAFLMLSDATIRRWCGPKWRIGASRRTRAAAILHDLQMRHADTIVTGEVQAKPLDVPFRGIDLGEVRMTEHGVQSSIYGTTDFLTPIVELELTHATEAEAQAYDTWRDGYERNWSGVFDPIGLRLGISADQATADLTVMPLIGGSQYRALVQLVEGVEIAATAGDPHDEAMIHVVYAINVNSEPMETPRMTLSQFVPGLDVNPLGWMGQSISVYADADPFWKDLLQADDRDDFMEHNFHRLPVALHAEVSSGLKLVAFIGAIRAMIEQSAPGMTVWTPLQHNGQGYVRVTPSAEAKTDLDELQDLAIYYLASGDGLVVTFREDLIHRAIDRQVQRRQQAQQADAPAEAQSPWLGKSLAARVDTDGLQLFSAAISESAALQAQLLSWKNLPILNEWKRLYPDRDPLEVHQVLFHTRLVCPGGGQYVWNEEARTMESTVYGHPAAPKDGPAPVGFMDRFESGDFGITFEDQGLRARAVIRMRAAE